jgi:hypothetical protein
MSVRMNGMPMLKAGSLNTTTASLTIIVLLVLFTRMDVSVKRQAHDRSARIMYGYKHNG